MSHYEEGNRYNLKNLRTIELFRVPKLLAR